MVSLAVGVLCAGCLITLRLAAAKLILQTRRLFGLWCATGSKANSNALTTDELSDYHHRSAPSKGFQQAGNSKR